MRAATPAVTAYLAAVRAGTQPLVLADCYTFTLASGTVLTFTNYDIPVTIGATIFSANGVLVDGLAYDCKVGVDVDQQQITLAANPTDTVNGVPFLQALAQGLFDGCMVQRDRAFLSSGTNGVAIGSINLFTGRLATVDQVGRTEAQVTVASGLVLLNIQLPRNFYSLTCNNVLYDSLCGLVKESFGTNGQAGTGSTAAIIAWAGINTNFVQGSVTFLGGANAGQKRTIKSITAGVSFVLNYPLPNVPSLGDAFRAYWGCDHRMVTCDGKFSNKVHFRGFPFIPPPATAY